MINFQINSVASINSLSASYYDTFYRFKQYKENYEQGFSLNTIYALNNVVDSSINNYSIQYLTSKKNIGDIIEIDAKVDPLRTITTKLAFNSLYGTDPRYLYIYTYANTISANPRVTACRALLSSDVSFKNNSFFELEIVDSIFLRVKHNIDNTDYYLNYIPQQNTVAFFNYYSNVDTISAEQNDMFRYIIDSDGYLQLFKNTSTGNRVLTLTSAGPGLDENFLSFVQVTSAGFVSGLKNVIKIDYNIKEFLPKNYSSWISYDVRKQNNLTINTDRSIFDRSDQYLLHANINESYDALNLNYITLNNIRSEKNYIKRGTNMIAAAPGIPDVEYREYMSLQTGNSQELGTDNIALTYVWYDKDIKVKNGFDTIFVTPSSIYPYTKLNINDTKFVENGSLAGLTPRLSDNIYQLRKNTDYYNNGRYLVTWLSGGTTGRGVWVDRYYYPDYVTKRTALSSSKPIFSPSFLDPVDALTVDSGSNVAAAAFFDKKSDLCIEPNCTYKYVRVGTDDINEFVTATSPVASGFNNFYDTKNNIQTYNSSEIVYDGAKYNVFNVASSINQSNSFTVSFDLYVDPEGSYGYQLFGNITNKGFGVVGDTRITPFINSYSGKTLKVYNTDLALLHTTEFDSDILDIIKGGGLDDYYVVCNGGRIYKVNTLGVKVKMEVVPEIVGYINYFYDGTSLYFAKNNTTLDVVKVDKNTLGVANITTSIAYTNYAKDLQLNGVKNSIIVYNDVVRSLPAYEVKFYTPDIVYYVLGNGKLIKHDLQADDVKCIISSKSAITDFVVDENYIYLIHNTNTVSIYTHTLDLITSFNAADIITDIKGLISVDIINQYPGTNSSAPARDIVLVYLDKEDTIGLYIPSSSTTVNTKLSGFLPERTNGSRLKTGYTATNFSYFNQFKHSNSIGFNLTLTNYLSTEDIQQKNVSFDYTTLDRGYHTFTYRFDPIQGNITLFVDGERYENLTVQPGKYAIQDILNDNFYSGTAGFYNNTDLATYLKQPGYYYLNGTRLKNVFIYDRPLSDDEILSLNIYDTSIDELVLSIPAGQRNNIEEIIQYFKFRVKDSSSKKINVYIKNAGITDDTMKSNIRNLILQESTSILPIGVNINDIQFVDFK